MIHFPKRILVGIAIGVTILVITAAYLRWQDISRYSDGQSLPSATIIREDLEGFIETKQLKKIAGVSQGSRSSTDNEGGISGVHDTKGNFIVSIYYRDDFFNEVVLLSAMNNSTSPITIDQLHLSGYRPCYIQKDCWRESLNRPIIYAIRNGVIAPTIGHNQVLQPSESIAGYIEGNLGQVGYAAAACYWYNVEDVTTHYCNTTSPVATVRWY